MMSIRYLAPLVECARRKNYMTPTDKRGMREALLQRQFWHHLQGFVEESARAEYEQMRREQYMRATAVDSSSSHHHHQRPISSSNVAARPATSSSSSSSSSAPATKQHLSKAKARSNTLPSESQQVIPKLSTTVLGPKKKLMSKIAAKKSSAVVAAGTGAGSTSKPHVIIAESPATSCVVRIPTPVKKRAFPVKVSQQQHQQHYMQAQQMHHMLYMQQQQQQQLQHQQQQDANRQEQDAGMVRRHVAVYQHPVLYTIVAYAPTSTSSSSSDCSSSPCPAPSLQHHQQSMDRDAIDAAAKEFMHFLAQRQHHQQQLLAQQQAV